MADVLEAAAEKEAGRAFGDQGPVPRSPAASGLAKSGVEGLGGGAEIADRPGTLGFGQPQQVQEIIRRVRGAFTEPPHHLVQLGQQAAALASVCGADLLGQGQRAQQADHSGRVEAQNGGQ